MSTTAAKLAKARAAVAKDEAKEKLAGMKAKLADGKAKLAGMPAGKAKAAFRVKVLELQAEVDALKRVASPKKHKKGGGLFSW